MVFDQRAYYPFRALVEGGLTDPEDLPRLERFLRAVVLHDESLMVAEPTSYSPEDDEWTEEEIQLGRKAVIVGFAPVLDKYDGLLGTADHDRESGRELAPRLIRASEEFSNATADGPGSAYYNAHLAYFRRLVGTVDEGGSVVGEGPVAQVLEEINHQPGYPDALFAPLDGQWQDYARVVHTGIGPLMPPVLSLVLSRAASRDRIPDIIRGLRAEWEGARRKIWDLVAQLRRSTSLGEANQLRADLDAASSLFVPRGGQGTTALRPLWDIFAPPLLAAAIGVPAAPAAAGAVARGAARGLDVAVQTLFGRGAFDLAKRVSKELTDAEPTHRLVARFLTADERRALGY